MRKTVVFIGLVGLSGTLGCSGDDGPAATSFTGGNSEVGNTETGNSGDGDSGDGDGDSGDGDGDSGDGDGDPGPMPCDVAEATLAPATPQVMLVLDKSGSMLITWDHDNDGNTPNITRWNSLHNVVTSIINTFDDQMDFGAILFPSIQATSNYNATACIVATEPEVPVGPDGQAVLAAIPLAGNMTLAGGTPGEDAVDVSGMHLKTLDPNLPKAIIYISDGAANCGDAANDVATALFENYDLKLPQTMDALWTNDAIPTYVVGIDISTQLTSNQSDGNPNNIVPWCKMDELGEVGGKPKDQAPGMSCSEGATDNQDFYAAANEIELQAALQSIIEDAISCTIVLDPIPPFPALLEVEIGGAQVPQVADCANEDGWVYPNPNGPYESIDLCGSWCDELKSVGSADVLYFCNPG